ARGAGECGNEAVQLAVELDFAEDFAAIGFESCTEVVEVDAAEFGHQPICGAARNLTHEPVIATGGAPAADSVVALFDFVEELGNLLGVVLKIAVHRYNDFAAGEIETGLKRGSLTEVAAKANQVHAAVVFINFRENFEGIVFATVVNKDELVRL